MANTQTDEFIKTMTANRVQLAKAGHHKEVWFSERRRRGREGEKESEGCWEGGGKMEMEGPIGWAAGRRGVGCRLN